MIFLRKILFPVAIIYWLVTYIRNLLYDFKIFESKSYSIPIIAVGNLSVGGTGKTPHIEYLIELLKNQYKIGVLSRGYKRSTKGYLLANESIFAQELGDESYQIYSKNKDIKVAVCEDRRIGIEKLIKEENCNLILLDDAFQHRKVKASFYILLTAFDDLFSEDYILPFGNLRESVIGKKRAHLVVVTKCPENLSEMQRKEVEEKLNVEVPVLFSTIEYDNKIYSTEKEVLLEEVKAIQKTIVAGIAKPEYFINCVKSKNDEVLIFSDHHHFTEGEIQNLKSKDFVITTEKDFVRLKNQKIENLFYLPIKIGFLGENIKLKTLNLKQKPKH